MGVDDTIQIRCPRCQVKFRDKARRVLSGYSRQCPSCERMLFFEDGAPIKDIHDALRAAERARKVLRQHEEDEYAARMAAAAQAATAQTEDVEDVTTFARRGFDRRGPSSGRSR